LPSRWIAKAALCQALLTGAPHSMPTIPRFGGLEISIQGWRVANPNLDVFEDTLCFHQ
jgi:hypothetical protein